MTDEIRLTLPRDRRFYDVAHLVLGGLATRLDVTWEDLDDLQVALAGLLDQRAAEAGDVTVSVRVEQDAIRTLVGPFPSERLRASLERAPRGGEVSLARLLETVADGVEIDAREGGDWVELTKSVQLVRS